MQVPYNPAILCLGISPREMKTYVHRKTCAGMCIAVLFVTLQTWKQPSCPSTSRELNKAQSARGVKKYSSRKRNEPGHADMLSGEGRS
jgi:hypothetical protein